MVPEEADFSVLDLPLQHPRSLDSHTEDFDGSPTTVDLTAPNSSSISGPAGGIAPLAAKTTSSAGPVTLVTSGKSRIRFRPGTLQRGADKDQADDIADLVGSY
ncbi:hypothetical protein Dimus_009484 [Dionaea muscipula]